MNEGFVKLPRSITNWRWYTDANVFRVYIHLFFKAAFKESEWKTETIKKGQVIAGRKMLAEELNISESQVRTALLKLENSGEITIKATNKYSIITLLKWAEYEEKNYFFKGKSPTNRHQAANKSPHKNNVKKENNAKNYNAHARKRENAGVIDSIDWSLVDLIINTD